MIIKIGQPTHYSIVLFYIYDFLTFSVCKSTVTFQIYVLLRDLKNFCAPGEFLIRSSFKVSFQR
jgi:hypothetical protein